MNDREEIAKLYGFDSFAELLDISDPLPKLPGDNAKTYVARRGDGSWFIWEDIPAVPKPVTKEPL